MRSHRSETDLGDRPIPKCAMTLAEIFVALELAATVNDVRLACNMGCVFVDGVRVRNWNDITDPLRLNGRTLRFINRECCPALLQMSLLCPVIA